MIVVRSKGPRKKARHESENESPIEFQTHNPLLEQQACGTTATPKSDDTEQSTEDAWSRFDKMHSATESQRKTVLTESKAQQPPILGEYEQNRLKNIQRNLAMLEALGIKKSTTSLSMSLGSSTRSHGTPALTRKSRQQSLPAVKPTTMQTRRSRRDRGRCSPVLFEFVNRAKFIFLDNQIVDVFLQSLQVYR